MTSGEGLRPVVSESRAATLKCRPAIVLSQRQGCVIFLWADEGRADDVASLLALLQMAIQNEPISATVPQAHSSARPRPAVAGDVQPQGTLAFVVDAFTPYRLHLHRRLANELRELRLASLFTHEQSNAPWALKAPPEI